MRLVKGPDRRRLRSFKSVPRSALAEYLGGVGSLDLAGRVADRVNELANKVPWLQPEEVYFR